MTVIIFVTAILVAYLAILAYLHELALPRLDLAKLLGKKDKYKVLVIYPHPDDETMASGGLIAKMVADKRYQVHCVSLTRGEHGDELLKIGPQALGELREKEFGQALGVLGVEQYEIWDFADGGVKGAMPQLKHRLQEIVEKHRFDLVITYERAGLYGHPDHIALSLMVHELQAKLGYQVLYMTLARNLLKHIKLPRHMVEDSDRHLTQASAEYRVFIGWRSLLKYLAARQYKSQKLDHTVPLWAQALLFPCEYYTTKYDL